MKKSSFIFKVDTLDLKKSCWFSKVVTLISSKWFDLLLFFARTCSFIKKKSSLIIVKGYYKTDYIKNTIRTNWKSFFSLVIFELTRIYSFWVLCANFFLTQLITFEKIACLHIYSALLIHYFSKIDLPSHLSSR